MTRRYRITEKGRLALEEHLRVKPGMNSGPLYTMFVWVAFVAMVAMCVSGLK